MREGRRDDVDLTVFGLERDVVEVGMEGDGEGRGEGPGGGGPDDGGDFFAGERGVDRRGVAGELVADVDAGAGVLLVLDFGVGEGGAVVDAPVDRLEASVDEALLEEVVEGFDDARLVRAGHGGVGIVPAAEDAEADELRALQVDVLLGVLAAVAAELGSGEIEFFAAELLVDFDFDGEAVAVAAGDVGGVEAGHGFGFDDEVFEAFVEGVAEVDGSVGVGRAVVEDLARCALAGLADLVVKMGSFPGFEASRLILRQIGLHGEAGLGQGEGVFEGWVLARCGGAGRRTGWWSRGHHFSVLQGFVDKSSLYPVAVVTSSGIGRLFLIRRVAYIEQGRT